MQRLLAILVSACALSTASAQAALIGGFDKQVGFGALGASDSVYFSMGYSLSDHGLEIGEPIFLSLLLTGDTTLAVDSGPAFEAAAAKMTDGVIEGLGANTQLYLGGAPVQAGSGSGFPEIDLSGFLIDAFVLTVTDFSLMSPGADPNGDGNWTDVSFNWRLDIYGAPVGEVPLPAASALFLFGLGGLGLAVFLRRRARRSP